MPNQCSVFFKNLRAKKSTKFETKVVHSPVRNTNVHKNSQPSQGYIFRTLQYFDTKLCNLTNFKMLFLDVAKLVRTAWIKSQSIMRI